MKQYILLQDYRGLLKDTVLYGPFLVTGGNTGYFQKEDIPPPGESGTACIFSSTVESSPLIFEEIVNSQP